MSRRWSNVRFWTGDMIWLSTRWIFSFVINFLKYFSWYYCQLSEYLYLLLIFNKKIMTWIFSPYFVPMMSHHVSGDCRWGKCDQWRVGPACRLLGKNQIFGNVSQDRVSETGGGRVQVQWSREARLLCEHPVRWQHPSLLCWREEWIPCQNIQILVFSIFVQMFMNIPQHCCSQIIVNIYSSRFSSAIACWITFTLSTNSWWASLSLICVF